MLDIAIVAGIRTPFARAFGPLASVPAYELGRIVTEEVLRRAQLRPAAVDRGARRGRALVGRDVGVEPHPFELAHVEIELFACDLQEAGGVPLPELALAEVDGRGVVGMHRDPGIDRARVRRTGNLAARERRLR